MDKLIKLNGLVLLALNLIDLWYRLEPIWGPGWRLISAT